MELPHKIRELKKKPKVLRERTIVFAWAISALSFVTLAASAVQMPGAINQKSPIPLNGARLLPAPGPVTTTASISGSSTTGSIQVYGQTSQQRESKQQQETARNLKSLHHEVVSLRRSMLRLTEQNRRLSDRINELDVQSATTKQQEPEIVPAQKLPENSAQPRAATPVETMPAPEVSNLPKQANPLAQTPLIQLAKMQSANQQEAVILPSVSTPQTVASITKPAPSKIVVAEFSKTPAAGKLSHSGAGKIKRTSFAIDLGSFGNINELEAKWMLLKSKHPKLLGTLKKQAAPLSKEGETLYQLIAGPFYNAADTAVICARLAREKVNCSPAVFQ